MRSNDVGNCEVFDLKSLRCPMAASYARRGLFGAIKGGFKGVVEVRTIEPSFKRDLAFLVNQTDELTMLEISEAEITQETRSAWLSEGEATNEDLLGVSVIHSFFVKIT